MTHATVDTAVAAVDIGGTKTAAALVTASGEVLARTSAPTPGRNGPGAVLQAAADLVQRLRTQWAATTVPAVGVGSAGVIDAGTGRVLSATDAIAGWAGTDLRGELRSRLGLPVGVINDVHAHALGESRQGSGAGEPTVLFMAVGTGIGASFVADGRVLAGAHSVAGHAGHQPSPYAAKLTCTCGGRGHLEAIASGPALVAEYNRRGGTLVSDLREVSTRAAQGDPVAAGVVVLGGAAVGSALGGLANVLDPHAVVLGGGVTALGGRWWSALRDAFRADALPVLAGIPVRESALGADAPLVGAAGLAWELVG
jgi:glucokinase